MKRFRATLICAIVAFGLFAAPPATRAAEEPSPVSPPVEETGTHVEIEPLAVEFERIASLRLDGRGRLWACDAGAKQIKVISPAGELLDTIDLEFAPEAIDVAGDGTVYCGGEGRLAILGAAGEIRKTVEAPKPEQASEDQVRRHWGKPQMVSGIGVSDTDVFVALGAGWSMGSKSRLFRFDRQLGNPKLLAEGLRGCCQRCDIAVRQGKLYLAENAVHRVVCMDRDGNVLAKWGQRSRTDVEGFGSCCNPMNLGFDAEGVLFTAESGLGRVKRYSADGEFLDLVGSVGVDRFTNAGRLAASCSNIAIAITPDGNRVYVMDFKNNAIRVLQKKG